MSFSRIRSVDFVKDSYLFVRWPIGLDYEFSASIDALVTTVNVGIVSFCDAANEHSFPILPRSTECAIAHPEVSFPEGEPMSEIQVCQAQDPRWQT